MHYKRWLKHSSPHVVRRKASPAQEFLNHAAAYTGKDCLKWPYFRNNGGYGTVWFNGKTSSAHREVCALVNGPPQPGQHVAHSCGNGHLGCVTPAHLRWASRAENMADMIAHGRSNSGTRNHTAKLTPAKVRKIRKMVGKYGQKEIAEIFDVTQNTISAIATGKTWTGV